MHSLFPVSTINCPYFTHEGEGIFKVRFLFCWCHCIASYDIYSRLIPGLRPANERWCYKVTMSFIGWAQTWNQSCILDHVIRPSDCMLYFQWHHLPIQAQFQSWKCSHNHNKVYSGRPTGTSAIQIESIKIPQSHHLSDHLWLAGIMGANNVRMCNLRLHSYLAVNRCGCFDISSSSITGWWIETQLHWMLVELSLITKFMGPTGGPPGADRTQVGPMLAPWTFLSGVVCMILFFLKYITICYCLDSTTILMLAQCIFACHN